MKTVNSLIATIKTQYSSYNSSGLIDEVSIYDWVIEASKKFGENVMILQDTVVEVKDSMATLPDNYYSLYSAHLCEKKGYVLKDPKHIDTLQQSYMWVERVERSSSWNSCEPCCKEDTEKTIVEKYYFRDVEAEFHYKNPILLKLGKTMKRNKCHKDCRNLLVRDNPNEITINQKTLQSNFREGNIYIQYYGLETDEDGSPLIPESPKGEVEKYIEYYVKRNFFEGLIANGDDPNARTLFQFYIQKEDSQLGLALTDAKFSRLTPDSFKKLQKINRAEMLKYEMMFPKL